MDINELSGHDLEDLVERLIKKLGFTIKEKKGADGGIDIRALMKNLFLKELISFNVKDTIIL